MREVRLVGGQCPDDADVLEPALRLLELQRPIHALPHRTTLSRQVDGGLVHVVDEDILLQQVAQAPDELEPTLVQGLGGPQRRVAERVLWPSVADPVSQVDVPERVCANLHPEEALDGLASLWQRELGLLAQGVITADHLLLLLGDLAALLVVGGLVQRLPVQEPLEQMVHRVVRDTEPLRHHVGAA